MISRKYTKIMLIIFLFYIVPSNTMSKYHVSSIPRKKSVWIALMKVWIGAGFLFISAFSGGQGIEKIICSQKLFDNKYIGPTLIVFAFPPAYVGYKIIKNGLNDLDEIAQY